MLLNFDDIALSMVQINASAENQHVQLHISHSHCTMMNVKRITQKENMSTSVITYMLPTERDKKVN